jgi:hypothetical protein
LADSQLAMASEQSRLPVPVRSFFAHGIGLHDEFGLW